MATTFSSKQAKSPPVHIPQAKAPSPLPPPKKAAVAAPTAPVPAVAKAQPAVKPPPTMKLVKKEPPAHQPAPAEAKGTLPEPPAPPPPAPATVKAEEVKPSGVKNFAVTMIQPQALKPYYRNNKEHQQRQVTLLARVLRTYGFDQPIVVDKDYIIIKGHGRWMAAMEAKISMVPIVMRDDLQDWEVQAARIADNQAFAMSGIDNAKAREEINDFVAQGGVGAEFYFDFLRPPADKNPNATTGGAVTNVAAPEVGGLLLTCPKCTLVFMEASV